MLFPADGKINSLKKEGAGLAKFCAVVYTELQARRILCTTVWTRDFSAGLGAQSRGKTSSLLRYVYALEGKSITFKPILATSSQIFKVTLLVVASAFFTISNMS